MKYTEKTCLLNCLGRTLRFCNQKSRDWTHPYEYEHNGSNLSNAGCGIFALTHAVEWMHGTRLNPDEVAEVSVSVKSPIVLWRFRLKALFCADVTGRLCFWCARESLATAVFALAGYSSSRNVCVRAGTVLCAALFRAGAMGDRALRVYLNSWPPRRYPLPDIARADA